MADQPETPRKMSPEFWAIIGTGVALFASLVASTIALASLILTVADWQRADMRDLREKVEAIEIGQGDMRERLRAVEVGQESIRERLAAVEIGQDAIEIGQDAIRERLSAVESRIGAVVVDPHRDAGLAIDSA